MRNDIESMSKKQLEAYARKDLGIELDRRHNKDQLLARVKGLLDDQKTADLIMGITELDIRKHIEETSVVRRDSSTIWGIIKDGKQTDDEIREIVSSHNFETLLGEIL